MARELKTATLDQAARYYASIFLMDKHDGLQVDRVKFTTGRKDGEPIGLRKFSRDWVMLQFHNFTFKDEFEYLVAATRSHLGGDALAAFDDEVGKLEPRSEEMFQQMLRETGKVA